MKHLPELVCVSVVVVKLSCFFTTAALVLPLFLMDSFSSDLREFPRAATDMAFSRNLDISVQLKKNWKVTKRVHLLNVLQAIT